MGGVWGVVFALCAAVLWGSIGVAFRLGVGVGASAGWLVLGRPLVAGLVSLACLVAGFGRVSRWSVVVGLVLAPFIVVYLGAVSLVGAALASILLYTAPMWVAVLGRVVLGEGLGCRGVLALVLGFVGVVLAVGGVGSSVFPLEGVLLGLLSGLLYACYIVLARVALLRGASSLEVGLHSQPIAALGVAAISPPPRPPTPVDVVWALYMGVATMLVPYMLNARALALLEAYRVSIISLVEPVSATLLAHLLLHETLTREQLIGASLVLLAAAITSTPSTRKNRRRAHRGASEGPG